MDYCYSISWEQKRETVIEKLEKIKLDLQNCFVNPSFDAQCELSKLSQVNSVLNYQLEFEKWSSRATETPELILVSLFISGLKPDIRRELQLNRPFALKEAFASARYHESRLEGLKQAVTEVEDESKLMVNKVDVELPSFEPEEEAKEVEDELTSLAMETAVAEVDEKFNGTTLDIEVAANITNECDGCQLGKSVVNDSVWQSEAINEEGILSSTDVITIDDIPLIGSLADIYITTHVVGGGRNKAYGILQVNKLLQAIVFMDEDGIIIANFSSVVRRKIPTARRTTVFKFYALKEVYQKPFDFHLEDKVDLKESGMIRHGII